jgi:Zn-dependent peptidase ImmA (M78 family)/transcriptional regulator with XRE-family HTH domain
MSSQRASLTVKPGFLTWARETASLNTDEAARKIGVKPERLVEWEAGTGRPTVPQIRKAAGVYRRPLAAFFLAEPPARPVPLHDFRRLPAGTPAEPLAELLLQMRRARRRRTVAVALTSELGHEVAGFSLRATLDEDAEVVAARARSWLGVPAEEQSRWTGDYSPFNAWIAAFEARGVLVFQTGDIALEEMRGFTLAERRLPVIVLNAKDAPEGRIFTLMHELTHLMLGQDGVCDPLQVGRHEQSPDERVEVYCNRVAGAILVPRDVLLAHPRLARVGGPRDWSDEDIQELADHFAVSREAIVRRLVIVGRATEAFYDRKRAAYLVQYRTRAAKAREGFAPPFRVILRDNGRQYTRLVLDALDREQITLADVSDYLGVRIKHLEKIAGAVEHAGAPG